MGYNLVNIPEDRMSSVVDAHILSTRFGKSVEERPEVLKNIKYSWALNLFVVFVNQFKDKGC